MSEQIPSVGRIVHYKLPTGRSKGEVRPAMIVKVWSGPDGAKPTDCVNLQVFTDGSNDSLRDAWTALPDHSPESAMTLWVTSAMQGDQPGQWSWPPRV